MALRPMARRAVGLAARPAVPDRRLGQGAQRAAERAQGRVPLPRVRGQHRREGGARPEAKAREGQRATAV